MYRSRLLRLVCPRYGAASLLLLCLILTFLLAQGGSLPLCQPGASSSLLAARVCKALSHATTEVARLRGVGTPATSSMPRSLPPPPPPPPPLPLPPPPSAPPPLSSPMEQEEPAAALDEAAVLSAGEAPSALRGARAALRARTVADERCTDEPRFFFDALQTASPRAALRACGAVELAEAFARASRARRARRWSCRGRAR